MQNIAAQTNGPCASSFRLNAMPWSASYLEKSAQFSPTKRLSRPSPYSNNADVKTVCRRRLRSSAPRSTVFLQCPQTTTHKNEPAISYGLRMNHNGDRCISQFSSAQFCR